MLTKITIAFGILLVVLGAIGYAMSGYDAALVPGVVGIISIVLALVAMKPTLHMHAMHGVMLLVVIGGIVALVGLWRAATGTAGEGPEAAMADYSGAAVLGATAGLCLIFLAMGIRSFISARRAREQAGEGKGPAGPGPA